MNWDLLEPRNLIVTAAMALVAIFIYKHFEGRIAAKQGA